MRLTSKGLQFNSRVAAEIGPISDTDSNDPCWDEAYWSGDYGVSFPLDRLRKGTELCARIGRRPHSEDFLIILTGSPKERQVPTRVLSWQVPF